MRRICILLEDLSRCASQNICQPLWTADHEAMTSITLFHHVEGAGLNALCVIDHVVHQLRSKARLIFGSNHIRRWDMTPGCPRGRASVHPGALVDELRSPCICFLGREVVVEDLFGVFSLYCNDAVLESVNKMPGANICSLGTYLWVHLHPFGILCPSSGGREAFGHCECHDEHKPDNASLQIRRLTFFFA
jgi:hypothetical protein